MAANAEASSGNKAGDWVAPIEKLGMDTQMVHAGEFEFVCGGLGWRSKRGCKGKC